MAQALERWRDPRVTFMEAGRVLFELSSSQRDPIRRRRLADMGTAMAGMVSSWDDVEAHTADVL